MYIVKQCQFKNFTE